MSEQRTVAHERTARRTTGFWLLGLFVLVVAFWWFRVFDSGVRPEIVIASFDMYAEHYPATEYGFGELSAGRIAHWNPFQLTGVPFQAVPYVGLLYPPNWLYLLVDAARGAEVSFVLHLFLAGLGAFLLAREIGWSRLAGMATGLTFMWSGWMSFLTNQASLVSGMSWLPITLYAIERTIRGRPLAPIGVALAVASQLLNGATEFFVYNMYASGAFSAVRLVQLGRSGDWRGAVVRGAALLGVVGAGILLATPQLLPSIELASLSERAFGALSIDETVGGSVRPWTLLVDGLMATGMVTVGILPFAGGVLGFDTRWRGLWAFLLALAAGAALLSFGGTAYALYFETPLGGLFRRPNKFLHLYSFAQAGLAGLAVMWLEAHVHAQRRALWRNPAWALSITLLLAGVLFLASRQRFAAGLLVMAALLIGFGSIPAGPWRRVLAAVVVIAQGAILFFGVAQQYVRPAARPHVYALHRETVNQVRAMIGSDRIFLQPDLYLVPALSQKSGSLHQLRSVGDYQQLSPTRAREYFERVSATMSSATIFNGEIRLDDDVRWHLMDLAAVRLYVVRASSDFGQIIAKRASRGSRSDFRPVPAVGFPRVYVRPTALERARFVPRARYLPDADSALRTVVEGDFDLHREVVLVGRPPSGRKPTSSGDAVRPVDVHFTLDDPEHVVLELNASVAGWVVLADAWHPNWQARVNGRDAEIRAANHMFRAVFVEPGSNVVEFEYVARPFYLGVAASASTAAVLTAVGVHRYRRLRRSVVSSG